MSTPRGGDNTYAYASCDTFEEKQNTLLVLLMVVVGTLRGKIISWNTKYLVLVGYVFNEGTKFVWVFITVFHSLVYGS